MADEPVLASDRHALSWCLLGALQVILDPYKSDVRYKRYYEAHQVLSQALNGMVKYNDSHTFAQVQNALKKIAKQP